MNTNQVEQETEKDGTSPIHESISLIAGAFLACVFGIAGFLYQRGRSARDHLLVTVSLLSGELQRHSDPPTFYVETLPRLQEAVFRLRPFLRKSKAADLSTIWNFYLKAQAMLQLADIGDSIDEAFYTGLSNIGVQFERPKNAREIIEWFYKKFSEVAK